MYKFPPGTPVEVELQPDLTVAGSRIRLSVQSEKCKENRGARLLIMLPLNEESARQLHADLGAAIDAAYPKEQTDGHG